MVKNGIIWIIGLVFALTAGLTALGAIAKNKVPVLAATLHPMNGFAAENIASKSIKNSMAENSGQFPNQIDPKAIVYARKAFTAEPVTPEAVAVLALGLAGRGKDELMNEALLLSRRQPLVAAWMIADSGARKDIPALLNHYDTMLRTSTSAASVIIPMMAKALANDDFVAPFAGLLAKKPPWAYRFWEAVVAAPEAIGNAARLREMLYEPNDDDDIYRDANLIRALISNQQFETAEALYLLVVDQTESSSLLTNGSFETESEYFPIDWQLVSTGEYGAFVSDGKLKLSAIQNSGGLFARRLVKLPSKVVTMDVIPSNPIPDNARITVSLKCAQTVQDAPKTIRIPIKKEIKNLQIDNSRSGCSFYWLDIYGRDSANGDGFDIALDALKISS